MPPTNPSSLTQGLSFLLLLACCVLAASVQATGAEISTLHQLDLEVKRPPTALKLSSKTRQLWVEALASPEMDLRREAAQAIGLAHSYGYPHFEETVPQLISALESPDAHRLVRLAAARALVILNASQAAEPLMQHALRDGWEMAQVVEPALAKWSYAPMRAIWLERLNLPRTSSRQFMLATQAAVKLQLGEASPRLRELALSRAARPNVRVDAALTLGQLQSTGLEPDARRLLEEQTAARSVEHLVAAALLRQHSGAEAEGLMLQLALSPEASAAALPLARLLEINPARTEPINPQIVASDDAKVRGLAAQILAAQKTPSALAFFPTLLGDRHPEVRTQAQDLLIALGNDAQIRAAVDQTVMQTLSSDNPRALASAAIVASGIGLKPATPRLIELLDFDQPDVALTGAWALREARDPAAAAPLVQKLAVDIAKFQKPAADDEGTSRRPYVAQLQQFSLLLEAFGLMRSHEAEPLLLPLAQSRSPFQHPAIWALGHIYENDPQPEMVATLEKIVQSRNPLPGAMAATALARMQAKDSVKLLRTFYKPGDVLRLKVDEDEIRDGDVFKYVCAVAVSRITGEPRDELLIPEMAKKSRSEWFLQSLEKTP